MKTPFDFASVLLFALLAVVYLHRSSKAEHDSVPLWAYALAALGCAGGDVLANKGYILYGAILLAAALVGVGWITLKPPTDAAARK